MNFAFEIVGHDETSVRIRLQISRCVTFFFYLLNFHWLEDPKLGGGDVGKLRWRVSLTQKKNRIWKKVSV